MLLTDAIESNITTTNSGIFAVNGRTVLIQFFFPDLPAGLPESVEMDEIPVQIFTERKSSAVAGIQLIHKDPNQYWEIELAPDFEFGINGEIRNMPHKREGESFKHYMVRLDSSKTAWCQEEIDYVMQLFATRNFLVRTYLNSMETEFFSINLDSHRRKNKSTATKKLIISRETIEIIDL
jgi:hypothetical protein